MKILNIKVKLAVVAFCRFMKSKGISLEQTLAMVEETWGDGG